MDKGTDVNGIELLDGEEVRDVVGFEGLYLVSNYGGIWKIMNHDGTYIAFKQNRRMPRYIRIALTKNSKRVWKDIHRLVAEAFVPNPHNKECVNHIDGNKLNSRADNLEWMTEMENQQHA